MLGLDTLTREQKRQLVEALSAEGAFKGKSAANLLITDHQIVGLNTLTDSPSLFAPEPTRTTTIGIGQPRPD